jgi:hypothetical protein
LGRGPASGAERVPSGGNASRLRTRACAVAGAAALLLPACGGPARQDEDEKPGRYRVEVTEARFPDDQKLAKSSRMTIAVRNVDTKTIPNIAVTVGTGVGNPSAAEGAAGLTYQDDGNEDPAKPIFVIDTEPRGGDTAYVDTWALGPLAPGQSKTFNWDVTAVEARPYEIRYRVSAGLDPGARAITSSGAQPAGRFRGEVVDTPPEAKVADSGEDVVKRGQAIEPR